MADGLTFQSLTKETAMRQIGTLKSESDARKVEDLLLTQNIPSQVQTSPEGWTIWVQEEDDRERARGLFDEFLKHPSDQRYLNIDQQAEDLRKLQQQKQSSRRTKQIDLRIQWNRSHRSGRLTLILILLCGFATVLISFGPLQGKVYSVLTISQYRDRIPPEVRQGQIWRLVTPVFMHAPLTSGVMGLMHLGFNMMWLSQLGNQIESRKGSRKLLLLILLIATGSNLVQYNFSGPHFYGMSGVVYGLLGYIWMKSKYDPSSGLFIDQSTLQFMLFWLVICFFMTRIANGAHLSGLAIGILLGTSGFRKRGLKNLFN